MAKSQSFPQLLASVCGRKSIPARELDRRIKSIMAHPKFTVEKVLSYIYDSYYEEGSSTVENDADGLDVGDKRLIASIATSPRLTCRQALMLSYLDFHYDLVPDDYWDKIVKSKFESLGLQEQLKLLGDVVNDKIVKPDSFGNKRALFHEDTSKLFSWLRLPGNSHSQMLVKILVEQLSDSDLKDSAMATKIPQAVHAAIVALSKLPV